MCVLSLCTDVAYHVNLFLYMYVLAPAPRIFLRPNDLPQGIVGEMHELVCLVVLSSTIDPTTIKLEWNFTSNDSRVTVIPKTITNNDTINIVYTTVIKFAYLMKGDEGNYACTLTVEDSVNSNFDLEIISSKDS